MRLYDDNDLKEAIARIKRGKEYVDRLRKEECHDTSAYIVFMFSEDMEINDWTLYYLPLVKKRDKVSEFLIVSPYDDVCYEAEDKCKCRHRFLKCEISDMEDVCRFYSTYREYGQTYSNTRVILNGSPYPEDNRIFEVIGYNGITKKEFVAFAIFRFDEIPEDTEVEKSLEIEFNYKKIDWETNKIPSTQTEPIFPDILYKNVDRLILSNKIEKGDKLILFSYTKSTRYLVEKLSGYNIAAILDNDPSIVGTSYKGISIYKPEDFLSREHRDEYRIIVPTRSYKFICEQLNHLGYEINKQVYVVYTEVVHKPQYDLDETIQDIRDGKRIYDSIREQHSDEVLYLVPYPGTGDMYLIGMYMNDRMRYDGVEKGVLVVASKSCRKIYSLLQTDANISEIVTLDSRKEAVKLLQFAKQVGYEKTRVVMINDSFDLIDIGRLRGYKNLDFNTLFQKIAFYAPERKGYIDIVRENADSLFQEYGIRKIRTVVLSPYTRSVRILPMSFWEELTALLLAEGYDVVTNVSGDEKAVSGTTGIMIPYTQIMDFIEKAGAFIGLRSGLCDIISGADAKKIILYPAHVVEGISDHYYKFFGLRGMGLSDKDLHEMVINENEHDKVREIAKLV